MDVDALAQELARRRVETLTRRDQPLALGLPPGSHVLAGHAALPRRARSTGQSPSCPQHTTEVVAAEAA
jgi:hypothetical protein